MAVTYVSSNFTTGSGTGVCDAAMPTGLVAGDVVFLVISGANTVGATPTPAGWTALREEPLTYGNFYGLVCFRAWTGVNDPTTVHCTYSSNSTPYVYSFAYRGVDNGQPVIQAKVGPNTATTTAFNSPSWSSRATSTFTAGQAVEPGQVARAGTLVLYQNATGSSVTPPAGWSGRVITNSASYTPAYVAERAVSAGAVALEGFTTSSSTSSVGIALVLQAKGAYPAPAISDAIDSGFVASSTGTKLVADQAVAGQYAVALYQTNGASSATLPTGWTVLNAYNGSGPYNAIVYKKLTPADCGSNPQTSFGAGTFTASSGTAHGTLVVIAGSSGPSQAVASNPVVNTSTANITYPSVTAAQANSAVLFLGGTYSGTASSLTFGAPSGVSKYADAGTAAGVTAPYGGGIDVAYLTAPSASANSTVPAEVFTVQRGPDGATVASLVFPPSSQPPLAPPLTAPATATYQDLASGFTFAWMFSPAAPTDTQQAYSFRRKISGAGAYEYWNAGTGAFQSTEVYNTTSAQSLTFAAGTWTDAGTVYNWSVNTVASNGITGSYAADNTVTGSAPPTTTVTAPVGTQVTQQPLVTWTTAVVAGTGEVQTAYQVVVETGTTAVLPGSGSLVYDSSVVAGSVQQLTIPTALANNVTYRVFVQTTETGGQTSTWGYSTFTVAVDGPATPSLTGSWDATNQRAVLVVQGRDNLLTANQASLETDTTGWFAAGNCTIARSTAQFLNGVASLALTSSAAGAMYASTLYGTAGVAVTAGQVYTAVGSFRAATVGRTVQLEVYYFTAGNTLLSTVIGAATADNSAGWTQATVTSQAPAAAAFAQVYAEVLATGAASEVHYVDAVSLAPGSSTTWTRGGLAGLVTLIAERSLDGIAWTVLRASGPTIPSPSQAVTLYDTETPPNTPTQYRVRGTVVV